MVSAVMAKTFKSGDHVEWNSEAGRVRGVILKKVVSDVRFNGYVHHATRDEPQYFIKSDKTEHIAIHKCSALRLLRSKRKNKARRPAERRATRRSDENPSRVAPSLSGIVIQSSSQGEMSESLVWLTDCFL